MTNNHKEKIIQLCFAISALTTTIGDLSLSKIVNIERIKKLKAAQKKYIEDLIDFIKSLQ